MVSQVQFFPKNDPFMNKYPELIAKEKKKTPSIQTQLAQLLPDRRDAVNAYLRGSLDVQFSAVIPRNLGRISNLPSHFQEYSSLLAYKVSPLKSSGQKKTKLSKAYFTMSPHYNQYNHHKITIKSPGVIRVSPKTERRKSVHSFLTPIKTYEKRPMIKTRLIEPSRRMSQEGISIYKGENVGGHRQGPGTAYYVNSDYYKGDWVNDKRNGRGSFYYLALKLKYKGEWIADTRNGQGTLYFPNGDTVRAIWENNQMKKCRVSFSYKTGEVYDGWSLNCLKDGQGEMKYPSSCTFSGYWKEDLREGQGLIKGPNFQYEGSFHKDFSDGPGILVHKDAIPIPFSESKKPHKTLRRFCAEFSSYSYFSKLDISDGDIIYATLDSSYLKEKCPELPAIPDGSFKAGKLCGAGIAQFGKFGTYIGNFSDGRRSGHGKFVYNDPENTCIWMHEQKGEYIGQWLNDQRHGFGLMKWPNNIKYEGCFKNDMRDSVTGTMHFKTGEIYNGGWVNNLLQGFGTLLFPSNIAFKGQFFKGFPAKEGVLEFPDGRMYEGTISIYIPHGIGKMTLVNGDIYSGNFNKGVIEGRGQLEFAGGDLYDGMWKAGVRNGFGKMEFVSGESFEGNWKDNQRQGYGVLKNKDGEVIYQGNWINDRQEGYGITIF